MEIKLANGRRYETTNGDIIHPAYNIQPCNKMKLEFPIEMAKSDFDRLCTGAEGFERVTLTSVDSEPEYAGYNRVTAYGVRENTTIDERTGEVKRQSVYYIELEQPTAIDNRLEEKGGIFNEIIGRQP